MSRINNHIRAVVFDDGCILFDPKTDRYILLDEEERNLVVASLDSDQDTEFLYRLEKEKDLLIDGGDNITVINAESRQLNDFVWQYRGPKCDPDSGVFDSIRAFAFLNIVQLSIRAFGIVKTLNILETSWVLSSIPPPHTLERASGLLFQLSRFSPFRFECLEYVIALFGLAHRKYPNLTFNIGVQRFPFVAHAWLEEDGVPVGDRPDLRNLFAVIFHHRSR